MKMPYIVSRIVLSVALVGALILGGLEWWIAVPAGAVTLVFFLLVWRTGRYVVRDGAEVTPFRRDERSRAIRDQAARNAFILTVLCLAGLTIAYARLDAAVPVAALGSLLALAAATYAVSELLLRRST
jgi:hypothetical protein